MIRYQTQEFIDNKTTLNAEHLQNIENAIINLETEVINISGGTVTKSINLFDIDDVAGLFTNAKYRLANGEIQSEEAISFDATYASSEKIYIGENTGTFHLDLEIGKTYRWQFVPYYEFGFLQMATPWGDADTPANWSGKRFWFYDANDNLIANDSTTSSDGLYLMTIPEGTVYMRFMGWYARSDSGNSNRVLPLYTSNLMVTEGETEYTEYVKPGITVEEATTNSHGCYCDFTDEVLSIVYHYNEESDMMVQLKRKGPNSIIDIGGWYTVPKKNNGDVQNDLSDHTTVAGWGSDFHGPFSGLLAKHNPLNDLGKDENGNSPPGFTGGNHGYKNTGDSISKDPQNTPTGRSGVFKVQVDGRELAIDAGMYGDKVNIYWENFIQARNTVLPDGSGREVLKEIHEVIFHNGEFTEEVKLVPLEVINLTGYYGIQGMAIQSVFGDCIYYGGSKDLNASRKMHATSVDARSETTDAYQALCIGPEHTLFMEVDPIYDMGARWGYTVTSGSASDLSSIFCSAGNKLYFYLVRAVGGIDMYPGQAYSFRCKYGVKPTQNQCAVRAINNSLTNVTENSNNPIVALVGHNTYVYYTAASDYSLPSNITVENASYTWNASTGELILYDVTATVKQKINVTIAGV